LKFEINKRG